MTDSSHPVGTSEEARRALGSALALFKALGTDSPTRAERYVVEFAEWCDAREGDPLRGDHTVLAEFLDSLAPGEAHAASAAIRAMWTGADAALSDGA